MEKRFFSSICIFPALNFFGIQTKKFENIGIGTGRDETFIHNFDKFPSDSIRNFAKILLHQIINTKFRERIFYRIVFPQGEETSRRRETVSRVDRSKKFFFTNINVDAVDAHVFIKKMSKICQETEGEEWTKQSAAHKEKCSRLGEYRSLTSTVCDNFDC